MDTKDREIAPGITAWSAGCNVYLLRDGSRAVAVDAGDGSWIRELPALGVERLDHVYLTHHHADQCALPGNWRDSPATRETVLHAPSGEQPFLVPERVRETFGRGAHRGAGCPSSYNVRPDGLPGIAYDMAGFGDLFWGRRRIRFLHTPGHGPAACSVLLDWEGRQVLFCGDAAHAGGTVWQPYNLEWDHWTGQGALSAWEGVERLRGVAADILCPSHGPVVPGRRRVRRLLGRVSARLMGLYRAKGNIAPGAPDAYVAPVEAGASWRRYSDSLWQFGSNGWLLLSRCGEALVVDPTIPDLDALEELRGSIGLPRPSACTVSHCHFDHCDGAPELRRRHGARLALHPWVAEPLRDPAGTIAPWLPPQPIPPDEQWPENGEWRWNEYAFRVAPFPGQTLWHCLFMAEVDGRRVAFTGDTFQPSSRWNGTGGFCAYNRSLFRDGFAASARLILKWRPEWLAAGHGTLARFQPARFRAVIRWAGRAERAVRALCPSGSLDRDYYAWGRGGPAEPATPIPHGARRPP